MTTQASVQDPKTTAGQSAPAEGNVPAQASGINVNELAKKVEEMEKRLSDKDRQINEIVAEKQTLEHRLSTMAVPPPTESSHPVNPAQPVFDPTAISELVDRQTYINKVKDQNADLIELGLEPIISQDADKYIRLGKSFRDALDKAVRERREIIEKKFKPTQTVPSGAQGETPSNVAPVQTPSPVEKAIEDEGDARQAKRMRLGL